MWEIEITHEGLHAYRKVRGVTKEEVETKARLQLDAWNARWKRFLDTAAARQARVQKRYQWERQSEIDKRAKEHALQLTKDAEAMSSALQELLSQSLAETHSFEWESLKDTSKFDKPCPSPPVLEACPAEPLKTEAQFAPQPFHVTINLVDWIVPGARKRKLRTEKTEQASRKKDAEQRFDQAHSSWQKNINEIRQRNETALSNREKAKAAWVLEKRVFEETQKSFNAGIEEFKKSYFARVPDASIKYWSEVLSKSKYPDSFPQDQMVSFDPLNGVLVVDYELPPRNALPNTKQVKYVANRQEYQEVPISETEFKHLYDDVLYQICLRTLYELFRADDIDVVKSIVFNGWVQAIDKATGANTHPCIMTVQANKAEFLALNLKQVDLKACFRSLKGISGSKLIDFSPVRPVLSLNREDPRFVGSYNVAESLNDKTNLAAMDWLDFENLIRELFEKEFSKDGGEVKITQASRDGGVDAIAFDPDPIRGGKIVIQAKRYTNTVGVAAVRDLFGTVHNEGATKGILVTTSDYGPDAYEFAKGKPLTLLTGSELLFLLGKHGYQAKIDLKEAKKLLGEY